MNMKTWIPLGLAVVLGVVAMFVAKDMLGKKGDTTTAVGNLSSIVVTKSSVEPGQPLTAEDLAMGQVSAASVPEGSFTEISQAVGRTTQFTLSRGMPVLQAVLAPEGAGTGWQALIAPGMRAITIEVNEFSGLAGMVLPGSVVDVVSTVQAEDNAGMTSRAVVQNVKVLAVGQRASASEKAAINPNNGQPEPFRNVTLLVKPAEAEAIQLVTQTGRPWLVLRNGNDKQIDKSTGVSIADLRGKSSAPRDSDPFGVKTTPVVDLLAVSNKSVPSTQPSNEWKVKIIRGGQESEVSFPEITKPNDPGIVTTTSEQSR